LSRFIIRLDTISRPGIDWRAAAGSGLIAGLVYLIINALLMWSLSSTPPWIPAYLLIGRDLESGLISVISRPMPVANIMLITLMIHLPLSIAYGFFGAWLIKRFSSMAILMLGAGYGFGIYVINFHVISPWALPSQTSGHGTINAFSHICFGIAMGLLYISLAKSDTVDLNHHYLS
jgi:hypothetical protein